MATPILPVVMAGGSGTRLWPLSRGAKPKQYQSLIGEGSMLEQTLARVRGEGYLAPAVIGAARHRAVIEGQIPAGRVVLEPFGRNTGPAAITAAFLAAEADPETLVLLLPADHHIADGAGFREAVGRGVAAARKGFLVTLGITPDAPETGYGYIKRGAPLTDGTYTVEAFIEKPERAVAESYLADGGYAWNAGIFLFRACDLLDEAARHAGRMLEQTRKAYEAAERDGAVMAFGEDAFRVIEGDSVDYAIMEKTERAAVVSPVRIGWNDIGSWAAVKAYTREDAEPACITIDCADTLIKRSDDAPLVAAVGLDGYVVVATKDSVLIVPEDRAQEVKSIVAELKSRGRDDLL